MSVRKSLPAKIKKLIVQQANSRCPFCGETNVDSFQFHHINEYANGGTDKTENLILVCANCHSSITNGTITKEEVIAKKTSLGHKIESLGKNNPTAQIFNLNNSVNNGIVGNTVNIKTSSKKLPKMNYPVTAIGSDLSMRNYIKHLIDRYNEYKKADKTIKGEFKYQAIYGAIKREFKCNWDYIPIQIFEIVVSYLQRRIDLTILGRNNKRFGRKNYSTYDEFLKGFK